MRNKHFYELYGHGEWLLQEHCGKLPPEQLTFNLGPQKRLVRWHKPSDDPDVLQAERDYVRRIEQYSLWPFELGILCRHDRLEHIIALEADGKTPSEIKAWLAAQPYRDQYEEA